MGTLKFIDGIGTYHVHWDNGRNLGLIPGEDNFMVLPPEQTMLRLYMPLTADLFEEDGYDFDKEPLPLDGADLRRYEDSILAALEKEKHRCPEEQERGLMHWYGETDSISEKVQSAVFALEEQDGQLWGVAECRIVGSLSPEELAVLKEYVTGQASDGWGENFEQRDIEVDEGVLNVHLWNNRGWSIQTEAERFGAAPLYNETNILSSFSHLTRCAEGASQEERHTAAAALVKMMGRSTNQESGLKKIQAAMTYCDCIDLREAVAVAEHLDCFEFIPITDFKKEAKAELMALGLEERVVDQCFDYSQYAAIKYGWGDLYCANDAGQYVRQTDPSFVLSESVWPKRNEQGGMTFG